MAGVVDCKKLAAVVFTGGVWANGMPWIVF